MRRPADLSSAAARLVVVPLLLAMFLGCVLPASAQGRGRRGGGQADREMRELMTPVVAEARRSVVTVLVDEETRVLGTVVDERGYILTKASELNGEGEITCRISEGEPVVARLAARDRANDLALLHVEHEGLTPVRLVEAESVIGSWVVVAGPGERPLQVGIISTQPRRVAPNRLVLGVMLARDGRGLVVTNLTEGYGAAEAGIEVGDVITHVMGDEVSVVQEVVGALQDLTVGDSVTVGLLRDEDAVELEVELRENRPDPRSRGERMNRMGGEVSRRNVGFELVLQHDAEIRPADCGGPLVNLDGEVIGINIARAGRIATYTLPTSLLTEKIERMIAQDTEPAAAEPPADDKSRVE